MALLQRVCDTLALAGFVAVRRADSQSPRAEGALLAAFVALQLLWAFVAF